MYGYNENTNQYDVNRGKRIFCSNRNMKKGCGRTISILKHYIIKNFTFTANTIWKFLDNILNGLNIYLAFKSLNINASISTPYRLFYRFKLKQSTIRSLLFKLTYLPDNSSYDNPVLQTIQHLKKSFESSICPISDFQYTTQTSIY